MAQELAVVITFTRKIPVTLETYENYQVDCIDDLLSTVKEEAEEDPWNFTEHEEGQEIEIKCTIVS